MSRLYAIFASALVCAVTLADHVVHAAAEVYVESFTTTTYKHPGTTAHWDTGTGSLKLPVFTPSLTGTYNTSGIAFSVAVAGDLAFVADEASGLVILNIQNLATPTLVGTYNTPGFALDVAVQGDLAYVADEASGLQIIDITNPASPSFVGALDTPGGAIGVAVDGELAFVADGFDGLHIIDVANPASPTLVKTYNTGGFAVRVTFAGNLVFVADDIGGVVILNVTDPTSPVLAGLYDTPGNATDIAVAGDRAYVADGTNGLVVLNILNPAVPTLAGSYNTPGVANDVVVAGDVAYIADDLSGIHIVNITNPALPTLAHTLDTSGRAVGIAVDGEHAFVADDNAGLKVIEVAARALPRRLGGYFVDNYRVAVDGDLALLAADDLIILDISNLAVPALSGTFTTPGTAYGVAIAGDLAFVADGGAGLVIVNIANPALPTLIGSYNTPGNAVDVVVQGNFAYVADGASGMHVINIQNPALPTLAGTYPLNATRVVVSGDLAFVAKSFPSPNQTHIVDVGNPASPTMLSIYATPGLPQGLVVTGDLLYLATDAEFRIVNIANPASPSLVGSIPIATYDIAVSGQYAFVALDDFGLGVLDVSDPTSPFQVQGIFGIDVLIVTTDGETVFMTDLFGLHTVEVFNHHFRSYDNTGQSLEVYSGLDGVVAARLSSTQTGDVAWEINTSFVLSWQPIAPDNTWTPIQVEGPLLEWRSTHRLDATGVNPTAFDLRIEWLYQFATVDAVEDVPNDQGGRVRLRYTRSGRDLAGATAPIIQYGVWRRVDDLALRAELARTPRDAQPVDPEVAKDFGALPLFTHAGRTFVESKDRETTGTMPPGTWEWVATIPALQQQNYLTTLDTSADAPSQIVLVVTAHTTTPSVWFASAPDSGSSLDNIAPPVPTNLEVAYNTGDGNTLSWDPSPASDFQTFRVYRSTNPGFTPGPGTLVYSTTATTWSDPDFDGWLVYYKVTAVDFANNESGPASAGTVTSIDGALPQRVALYQNYPNPFNPSTRIRYDIPSGGAHVELAIYDVSGRRVRTLVSGRTDAGVKWVEWDGRGDDGAVAPTGIYFARMESNGTTETRKLVLLK